jgi:hypothetical protein
VAGESAPPLSCCRRPLSAQSSSVFHSMIVIAFMLYGLCVSFRPKLRFVLQKAFCFNEITFSWFVAFWNYFPFSLPEFHNFLQSNKRLILQIYSDIRDGFYPS